MAGSPRTVLVYVGRDLMVDGLMKLPFVLALRSAFPGARITWLAGRGPSVYRNELAPLVAPLLDEVVDRAGVGGHWWELARRPMAGREFDLVIDTQRRVLTSLIVRRIHHGAFVSGAAGFRLSDHLPPNGRTKPVAIIRRMLDLVEAASGTLARTDASLVPDPRLAGEALRLLPGDGVYIGLAPGGADRRQCWPLENYIALAMRQVKSGRVPVIFLGGAERSFEGEIRDALPGAILFRSDECGMPLTFALARRLSVAVVNDGEAGHLMAAAEVPLVSLFGPTSPQKTAPFTRRLTILRAGDFGGTSMEAIPLETVLEVIERVLAHSRREAVEEAPSSPKM